MFLFIWTGAGYKYYCYHVSEIGSPPIRFLPATVPGAFPTTALLQALRGHVSRSSSVLCSRSRVLRSNVTRQRSFLAGAATRSNQLSFLGERSDSFIETERERANTGSHFFFSRSMKTSFGCVRSKEERITVAGLESSSKHSMTTRPDKREP